MSSAPNILLHSPVSNADALEELVETALRDGVELIATWGPGCEELHDRVDDIIIGDGSDESRFILTSWHSDESLEEVREFMAVLKNPEFREVRL